MRLCGLLVLSLTLAGIAAAQDSNFSAGPQYLMNYGSPMFMRPIATPTLSLSETTPLAVSAPPVSSSFAGNAGESPAVVPGPNNLANVYWGSRDETKVETAEVIEVSGAAPPANLPESILNVGVQETVDAQELRQRGFGVSVSETSSFWKAHKPRAVRVFTNRDVEKFHGD